MKPQFLVFLIISPVLMANLPVVAASVSSFKVEYPIYEVRESEVAVTIAVLRNGASDLPASVDYTTAKITASAGLDYTQTAGHLDFASGETLKLISIPILQDALKEINETFRFSLTNAIGGTLAVQKSATVTLKDVDPGLGFTTAGYFIHEDEPTLRVTVRRGVNPGLAPATVTFATVDGSAIAGQDYLATNGTLTFAEGELSRSFEVAIINDGILESDQNFRVILSNPTGGATFSALTNLTVTLCDATGVAPHGFRRIQAEADGIVKLTFSGGVSKRFQSFFDLYPVEVSTNLVDWQVLTLLQRTNSATNELTFTDPGGAGAPKRFYRTPTNQFIAAYPKPTGPYPVGRIDRLVTDPTRRNRYGISTQCSFAIGIWYPAAPRAGQQPSRWFEEVMARDTSTTSCWSLWESTQWFDRLPYLWTYSFSDAPLAEVSGAFPVVLYSTGYTCDRRADVEKLESLASNGYVVVAVEPYDALAASWPDGFYHSQGVPSQDGGLEDRVRDLVVVLDELTKWNRSDARFVGRLDLDRVGGMGFSWGGATVAKLAQQDARCRAVVLLDGGPDGSLQSFSKPSLTMHNSEELEQFVFAASRTNAVWFQISNTDHASFVNYVVFGSVPLADNREAVRTMNAYTLSFFNKWLKGQDDHLHESRSTSFPRVINYRKK